MNKKFFKIYSVWVALIVGFFQFAMIQADETTVVAQFSHRYVTDYQVACDASSSVGQAPLSYYWDFGDGSSSEEINPEHLYAVKGNHAIRLTVTDQTGQSSLWVSSVRIPKR